MEAGKRYCREDVLNTIYECVYADEHAALIRWLEDSGNLYYATASDTHWPRYNEYVEPPKPRTISQWVNVYSCDDVLEFGQMWDTKEDALKMKGSVRTYIDTVEINYTELTETLKD